MLNGQYSLSVHRTPLYHIYGAYRGENMIGDCFRLKLKLSIALA